MHTPEIQSHKIMLQNNKLNNSKFNLLLANSKLDLWKLLLGNVRIFGKFNEIILDKFRQSLNRY